MPVQHGRDGVPALEPQALGQHGDRVVVVARLPRRQVVVPEGLDVHALGIVELPGTSIVSRCRVVVRPAPGDGRSRRRDRRGRHDSDAGETNRIVFRTESSLQPGKTLVRIGA